MPVATRTHAMPERAAVAPRAPALRSPREPVRGVDAAVRGALLRALRGLEGCSLTLVDGDGAHVTGGRGPGEGISARVTVNAPRAYRGLARGSRGFAEAYADGLWDADDLVAAVRVGARAVAKVDAVRERVAAVRAPIATLAALRRSNTRRRSRSNVERHYDLGNDFFSLVLDETMGYSCAFHEDRGCAPLAASRANLDRVCRLLDLRQGDRLLEFGSGWGGLALHAATQFGCHVSTVTISPNQRDHIEALARAAGVEDRVSVLVCDYRDVRGRWDKLVSLEMVESVGARHLDTFAAQWGRLLRRDGLMVVQAITTHDRLFRVDRHRRTFLTDLIFPGGCTPSLEAIIGSVARRTRLRVAAVYDITPHYPPTLQAWQDNLQANWPRIERLRGFDERFRRLWTLYFAYCAAGFLERRVQDRQIVLAGPDWRDENRLLGLAPDACGPPATAGRTTVR